MENGKTNIFNKRFYSTTSILSSSLFLLPTAFSCFKPISGSIFLFAICIFSAVCLYFIISLQNKTETSSYPELCENLGYIFVIIYNIGCSLFCVGSAIAYSIYIVDFIAKLIPDSFFFESKLTSTCSTLIVVVLLFYIASKKKEVVYLIFHLFYIIFSAYICIFFLYFYFFLTPAVSIKNLKFNFDGNFGFAISLLMFTICFQIATVGNKSTIVKNEIIQYFGIFTSFVLFLVVGIFGFLSVGALNHKDFISFYFKKNSSFYTQLCEKNNIYFAVIGLFLFFIVLLGSFMMHIVLGESYLITVLAHKKNNYKDQKMWSYFLKAFVLFFTIISLYSDFKPIKIINVLGASISPLIGFVLPSVMKIRNCDKNSLIFWFAAFLILISITLSFYCIYDFIENVLKG